MKEITIQVAPYDVWRGEHITVHWCHGKEFYRVVFNNREQELLTLMDEDEAETTFGYDDFDGVLIDQTVYED